MFTLIATLLVVAVGLVALMWIGTTYAQAYFYDSPTDGLHWRAPAAAGTVWVFLALWTFIEYANPGTTGTLFDFTHEQRTDVTKFWSVRRSDRGDEEILFERRTLGNGMVEFRDRDGKVWSRSSSGMMVAILIEEKKGDETVRTRFNAEMKDGKFAPRAGGGAALPLRYVEEGGSRYIVEDQLGKIVSFKSGRLIWVILLNAVHFALWFAALWPLLRFQWPHALGFGFVGWLALSLALVPFLHDTARDTAAKRAHRRPATTAVAATPTFA